jgi:pimeloyl-ACP methyl ester carboxylesterase
MLVQPKIHRLSLPHPTREGETIEMTYYEWGAATLPAVLCVHGLSRNGRDFDYLASALCDRYRVIAVDMPGRGESPWLAHKEDYNYAIYAKLLSSFIDKLGLKHLDWIGTSMGGILGMMLAGFRPTLIGRLVLNDVGAVVSKEGLQRIAGYVGAPQRFPTREAAETYIRSAYTSFGLTEEWQWRQMFAHSIRELPEGGFAFSYDPGILEDMKKQTKNFTDIQDVDLRPLWKLVNCPVLILRGEHSDILSSETVSLMRERAAPTEFYQVRGAGHAPSLMEELQVSLIKNWLLTTPANVKIGRLSKWKSWCIRKLFSCCRKRT